MSHLGFLRFKMATQGTQVTSAATLFLFYFAIFIHYPVPKDPNELCIRRCNKLLFFKLFAYCSNFESDYAFGQQGGGQLWVVS